MAGGYSFDAIIFDMDGVVTQTALVHAKAWKATFDEYLLKREKRDGEPFKEFTHKGDYLPYVDGKPRNKGVQSFLKSRGIELPLGKDSDDAHKETIYGLAKRKNELFCSILEKDGVKRYEPMVDFIHLLKEKGIKTGVASSSKNCKLVLEKAEVLDLFETRVDGVVSEELGLEGKPEADIFTTAARNLGVIPSKTIVVEDATSGVAAGRNGGFGMVLGIAREDNEDELLANGADIVMQDLSKIDIDWLERWFRKKPEYLFEVWDSVDKPTRIQLWELKDHIPIFLNPYYLRTAREVFFCDKDPIFFLDYDGTLTPIVDRPELAKVSKEMKDMVIRLANRFTVCIVSGRYRKDVENLLGVNGLIYAGSHGFDIKGAGYEMVHPAAKEAIPLVKKITEELSAALGEIPGLLIERKNFSVAVHYRLVDETGYLDTISEEVEKVARKEPALRLMRGKKVFEILPNIDWDKGKAIKWIMEAMGMDWQDASVVYMGDDTTDEDAFRIVRTRGTGILVSEENKVSAGDYRVSSPEEVKNLFAKVLKENK